MEQLELVPYLLYEKEASGILWTELDRREKLNAAVGGSERTGTLAEVGEYLRAGGDDTDALGEDRFADGGWRGRRRWGRWRAVACGACAERSSWRGPFGRRRGPQPTWRRARTVRSCRWDWSGTESGHSTERVGGQGGGADGDLLPVGRRGLLKQLREEVVSRKLDAPVADGDHFQLHDGKPDSCPGKQYSAAGGVAASRMVER